MKYAQKVATCLWFKGEAELLYPSLIPHSKITRQFCPDPTIATRATTAMMTMKKLDIAALEAAVNANNQ